MRGAGNRGPMEDVVQRAKGLRGQVGDVRDLEGVSARSGAGWHSLHAQPAALRGTAVHEACDCSRGVCTVWEGTNWAGDTGLRLEAKAGPKTTLAPA